MNYLKTAFFSLLLTLVSCVSSKPAPTISDSTHFLILGGGYSAQGNQFSLESNMHFIDRVIKNMPSQNVHRLFADGQAGTRSLQYKTSDDFPDEFQTMYLSCFTNPDSLGKSYRPHTVNNANGPMTRKEIDKYFTEKASKLSSGDTLFIYYTGHGSKGDKKSEQNTGLNLWHDGVYRMADFSAKIQDLPEGVNVILVMAQCYSGGFQNVIFKDGDESMGLTNFNVTGFYSTLHNRLAAGCTAEINEADFKEFSSYFWVALYGFDRLERKIDRPDYDGDGRVSLDEAHTYTLINLESIDIPTKSSELILRSFTPQKSKVELGVDHNSRLEDFFKIADPSQKEAIRALTLKTGVKNSTLTELVSASDELFDRIQIVQTSYRKSKKECDELRKKVKLEITAVFPEMGVNLHPDAAKLINKNNLDFQKLIDSKAIFKEYEAKYQEQKNLKDEAALLDRQWVYLNRLIRVVCNVLYEKYFLANSHSYAIHRYLEVRKLEQGFLQ
jgi:hypothetical protein